MPCDWERGAALVHLSVNTFYNSVLYKAKLKFTILGKCVYASTYSRLICSWRRSINSEIKKFSKVNWSSNERAICWSESYYSDHRPHPGQSIEFFTITTLFWLSTTWAFTYCVGRDVLSPDSLKYCIEAQEWATNWQLVRTRKPIICQKSIY